MRQRAEWLEMAGLARDNGRLKRESAQWPVLDQAAYHGLAGEIVEAIEPHSEADPVAILANWLAAYGNVIGRGAFFRVGADRHHFKVNAVGRRAGSSGAEAARATGPLQPRADGRRGRELRDEIMRIKS